jgi:hypothetical protein
MNESTKSFRGRLAVKAEKFEGHLEATKALALSVAGVMFAMLMWTLMILLFYWAQSLELIVTKENE